MPIIQNTKGSAALASMYFNYPDQFVPDTEKQGDDWIKTSMDYWYTVGIGQCVKKKKKVVRNYKLVNGFLDGEDFYQEYKSSVIHEAAALLDTIEEGMNLPARVQNYSIIGQPLNTLMGEMSKRPDNVYIRAMDDDSLGEKQQALTDLFQQYMEQEVRNRVMTKLQAQGADTSDLEAYNEQVQQLTEEQMQKYLTSISTQAEKWGQKMLDALKYHLALKEKSEEGFRDMLISSEQYVHIYPDGSKMGIGFEVENPKNVWKLCTEGKKYTRDAYAAGTVHIMEFSEILHKYPFLTKEEIDHLKKQGQTQGDPIFYDSPLVKSSNKSGSDSIEFHTWDPYIHEERMRQQALIMNEELDVWMQTGVDLSSFGNMFVVTKAYWESKKRMGKLTVVDEQGELQTVLVDEHYKKVPQEVSIEWGYINQWYEGLKVGNDIYYVQPLEILDYCPIIGVTHEGKNSPAASLVDKMKPFQMIFNVCVNQLWENLAEEIGPAFLMNKRHVPGSKGGDNQDALDDFEADLRERHIAYVDDSPENAKGASHFNQYSALNLSLSPQMQSRMNMASWARDMCHELVGISRQRSGSVLATETATATNTALTQSYAQTEPYFVTHEYLWQQVYQAILDAALYIETRKPESTIHNITDGSFSTFSRGDLNLRDLQVYAIPRGREQEGFKALQALAQPMMQNGADFGLIAEMMLEQTSTRQMQMHIREFQKKKDEMEQQAQQQKQQEMDQQQQQFEAQMQQAKQDKAAVMENDNYNKDLDRINKKEVAVISALGFGKETGEDLDGNGIPDIYQTRSLEQSQQKIEQDHQIALQKEQLAQRQHQSDNALAQQQLELQKEKLKVERERTASQERTAKLKAIQKPKTPAKKK